MEIITEKAVETVLTESRAIDVVEQAFRDYSNHRITMGDRGFLEVSQEGDTCIFLPACHRSESLFSLKYAASFPKCAAKGLPTVQSVIWLFSSETGEARAMIHANTLTAMKTGAASAVATRHLARQDANVLTIIGAGEQAKTQLTCIARVRDLKEIRLVDRDVTRCRALRLWAESRLADSIPIRILSSSDEAVDGADIIVTSTTSNRPVLDGRILKPGAHINAIGSFTPDMQELDVHTIKQADQIVTDSAGETRKCAGDLIVPMKNGLIPEDIRLTELGDVITRKTGGRSGSRDITVYESVGFPPLDLAMAIEVYQQYENQSKGDQININRPGDR